MSLLGKAKNLNYKNKLTISEGLALGEKAILEGRVLTHEEAKKKLKKWL